MVLDKIQVTYLPINCNISRTGHKLQRKTLDHLIINVFACRCTHGGFIILSSVRELYYLILNQRLINNRKHTFKDDIVRCKQI